MLPLVDDAWVVAQRPAHVPPSDLRRPHAAFAEPERTRAGTVEDVATLLLVNRECPFRCVMCDLWKFTVAERVPDGAVAAQVEAGLAAFPEARHAKLYNAGNFFDAQAVPSADLPLIAERVKHLETVIIECHPKLVGDKALSFAQSLEGTLDIAMGLETIDPRVLPRLNKRMTLDDYRKAVAFCRGHGMHVRAFILVRAPSHTEEEGRHWAIASIEWAQSVGVECCVAIPTRGGNGAMEALGLVAPPSLRSLEVVLEKGIRFGRGRVFADLWGVASPCHHCGEARVERIRAMNLSQALPPPVECAACA
ncbi:MAG: hypothetical protein K2W96_06510 [Gemmataceae bacterium]|nr:hypothetical protein [Gemmataceae bacterium]